MKSKNKSSLLLLKLMFLTLLPVSGAANSGAAKVEVSPEVTGYIGEDVTLPCQLNAKDHQISLGQWTLEQPGGKNFTIIVFLNKMNISVEDTFLKDRVNISGQSLVIRDVEMGDEGFYTCALSTFPSGPLQGTTKLVVQVLSEQMQLSSGTISVIVLSVVLLLVILVASVYLCFIRRVGATARHNVFIDTTSSVRDVTRPSFIVKEQDVVYADVKHKRSNQTEASSSERLIQNVHNVMLSKDVVYAEVKHKPSRPATHSSNERPTQGEQADDVMYSVVFASSRF